MNHTGNIREPAVSGQFYAADADALTEQVLSCFRHAVGPGTVPAAAEGPPSIEGLVVPHAGLPYSGPVAAHAYGALGNAGRPGTVVVLGPNHTGRGAAVAVPENDRWRTPLGTVPIDDAMRESVVDATAARKDARAHAREHAVEVQLPFLQTLFDEVSILPISLRRQDANTARGLGEAITDARDETTVVVASSDLTHYEPHDVALERDELALERIRASEPDALVSTVQTEGLSVCGYGAIAAMLRAVEGEPRVLAHGTSGDTAGSKDEVVGYAAVAVR